MSITTILMLVVLAGLIFFMYRNSRKRSRDQASLRDKMQPGSEIMTNFGLYGKLLSIDEDDNTALVETTPGTIVKIHRQALSRVVEPTEHNAVEEAHVEPVADDGPLGEPEYGERVDGKTAKPKDE
jgi:preprotein translocase subunit YajC